MTSKRIGVIGECLIELNGVPFEPLQQNFGGDTLNTALYLSRLERGRNAVQYVTAIGTDALSDAMIQRWQAEGIDTSLVLRDAERLPGLYWIRVDANGERSFLYWRGESAARYLLQHEGFALIAAELPHLDLIHLSGISLAVLPDEDRAKLLGLLRTLAARGLPIAFDSNYRPRLWRTVEPARTAMTAVAPITHVMFVTFDDEQALWGDESPQVTLARLHAAGASRIVVKLGAAGCLYSDGEVATSVATSVVTNVVDTTAAGDAFNAAFLAGWLANRAPLECCRMGNQLAGEVIQHRGAIIPAAATPTLDDLLLSSSQG